MSGNKNGRGGQLFSLFSLPSEGCFPTTIDNARTPPQLPPSLGEMKSLRAGCFHYPPFTLVDDAGVRQGGVEVNVIKEMAKRLGLQEEFVSPSDGGQWGDIFENGSTTGLIGDIHKGRVDVGFAQVRKTRKGDAQDVCWPSVLLESCEDSFNGPFRLLHDRQLLLRPGQVRLQ